MIPATGRRHAGTTLVVREFDRVTVSAHISNAYFPTDGRILTVCRASQSNRPTKAPQATGHDLGPGKRSSRNDAPRVI